MSVYVINICMIKPRASMVMEYSKVLQELNIYFCDHISSYLVGGCILVEANLAPQPIVHYMIVLGSVAVLGIVHPQACG